MTFKCSRCQHTEEKKKNLKRIKGEWLCVECNRKQREKNRDYLLRNFLGVKKREDLIKEWDEKRKALPKIKSLKKQKKVEMYLTAEEIKERYSSFIKQGLSEQEARKRIDRLNSHLKDLRKDLNSVTKKEPKKEIKEDLTKKFLEGLK